MSTFRCRALKSKSNAGKETLLSKHLDILKGFRSTKKTVITNRRHLDDLKKTLREVEEQETSPEQIARALDLRDEIRVSEGELRSLERNEDEDKYYLANSDLIFKYYETTSETPECAKPSVEGGKRSVVDFLQPETEPCLADDTPTPHKRRQQGLQDFGVERKENSSRAKVYDAYMSNVDPTHVISVERIEEDFCPQCESEMSTNTQEGMSECLTCGYAELIEIDSDKKSFKEATNTDMTYVAYKRINHFESNQEWNSGLKVCVSLVACAA